MIKKINALIFLMLFLGTANLYAQFPYFESFKNSTATDVIFGGSPAAYLTSGRTDPITNIADPVGNGYLRLTNSTSNQTGFIHNNTSFPSKTGLIIEFEYFTYGGQADGITFFLYDAVVPAFNIGGFGGSLGYAQYKGANSATVPGVSGGYLGIGLDEYGNFSNPIEGRQGGITGPVSNGLSPNSITLRGKGNGNSEDPNNYKYLTSKRTTDPDLNFNLTALQRRPDPGHLEYRKAIIILEPKAVGYFITVKIVTGGATPVTRTVINRYDYSEPAPALVRYGIASSTGFYYNYHEIRNMRINTFEPYAVDDLNYKTSSNTQINIPILNNDVNGNNVIDPTKVVITNRSNPSSLITVSSSGVVTYKPQVGFTGLETFYYTVKDIDGLVSNLAKVEIDVQLAVKPVGTNDNTKTNLNSPVTINVLANDINNIGVAVTSDPTTQFGGTTVVNASGAVVYTPKLGFTGTDTFKYTLENNSALVSDPITVTVLVNSPPLTTNDNAVTSTGFAVDIEVLANDTDPDGPINKGGIIVTDPPLGNVTINNSTGIVNFSPKPGFSGTDSFFYTVTDADGLVSDKARIDVQVKPSGLPDNATTILNTPVTINVLNNDPSKTGISVAVKSNPLKGSVIVNSDNTIRYTPSSGSIGSDTFTYFIKSTDGLESSAITVTIAINTPPIAVNDIETTPMEEPITIDLAANDTDADGIINRASITKRSEPVNGTASQPDNQGNITYTPKVGFIGTDAFTYSIKDDKGSESNVATVTITVTSIPKIGLSKSLTSIKNSISGSFIVKFTFTVKNFGQEALKEVSVKDNLAAAFATAEFKIISVKTSGTLKFNPNYTGVGNIELLDNASTLGAGQAETIELTLNVKLLSNSDIDYQNIAAAEAISVINGSKTTDASVAGEKPDPFAIGDVTPSGPTFFKLVKGNLYIPEGFSPNNDGINDLFIISNAQGNTISMNIFNRWGNRVYKSSDYKNDWGGRCTEGITVGQDLPVGTYYYIIIIDNEEKHVGYITLNR